MQPFKKVDLFAAYSNSYALIFSVDASVNVHLLTVLFMGTQYANVTLCGVNQDELINYLSEIGTDSYVSPTENQFTTMYDSSFQIYADSFINNSDVERKSQEYERYFRRLGMPEAYVRSNSRLVRIGLSQSQSNIGRVKNLDTHSKKILKQYAGGVEGILVSWASHLSAKFLCAAFAVFLRDDWQLWYHLSVNGLMVDEYTTYAEQGWQPGHGILTELGTEIKGGNASKLCAAFGQEAKTDQVENILHKLHGHDDNYSFANTFDCEALVQLRSFPDSIVRHHALALALGISPWWVLHMSYFLIDKGEAEDYFDDYRPYGPDGREAMTLLKQAQPRQA